MFVLYVLLMLGLVPAAFTALITLTCIRIFDVAGGSVMGIILSIAAAWWWVEFLLDNGLLRR